MKDMMHKKAFKIVSLVLVVLLMSGAVTGVVYASSKPTTDKSSDDTTSLKDTLENAITVEKNANTDGKDETVYALGDANGNIQKLIVSEWLKNPSHQSTIQDYSELSDIKNTDGNETFSPNGKNTYVWNAAGSDIHYQGSIQKELPVKVAVTYFLDGKETAPADLAGKSGHVKIHFTYTNMQKVNADINGTKEDINIPFLMVSGVLLDTDKFKNVTVSSGQVVDDGSRNVVIGFAFPGLAKSLDITSKDIDIPEVLDIEADTTNFSVDTTLTVGITGMMDNIKIDSKSSLQDLKDSMNDLKDATNDLIDGSSDLYDGTSELYDKSQDLQSGVKKLLDGAKDLNTGAGKAKSGSADLRDGLGTLSKNSGSLNSGAKDIINAVFASATTQLRDKLVSSGLMTDSEAAKITLTSSTYADVFKGLSKAVTVTPAQVEAQIRKSLAAKGLTDEAHQSLAITIACDLMKKDSSLDYTAALTKAGSLMQDAAKVQGACAVIDSAWLADATHQALIAAVMGATGADSTTAAKIVAVAYYLEPTNPSSKFTEAGELLKNASVVASTTPSKDKITALCTAVANAATSTGNASLDAVKDQLDDVMKFYNGLLSYTGGVNSAYAGSKDLAKGISDLKDGSQKLFDGVDTLYSGSKKLVDGVYKLNDGAQQLKDGLDKFYDEGVKKLTDGVDGDLTNLMDRMSAVADAGRSYKTFGGKTNDMNGNVKFIYRTDSVSKDENK